MVGWLMVCPWPIGSARSSYAAGSRSAGTKRWRGTARNAARIRVSVTRLCSASDRTRRARSVPWLFSPSLIVVLTMSTRGQDCNWLAPGFGFMTNLEGFADAYPAHPARRARARGFRPRKKPSSRRGAAPEARAALPRRNGRGAKLLHRSLRDQHRGSQERRAALPVLPPEQERARADIRLLDRRARRLRRRGRARFSAAGRSGVPAHARLLAEGRVATRRDPSGLSFVSLGQARVRKRGQASVQTARVGHRVRR